jgi:pimeloyl-ACP methyl ester carboxylesterase
MQTHTATNGRVEYDDVGSGRPLVLLHAFPLSRAMWRPQVEGLHDVGRQIVPDLRGFGGTAAGEGNSVELMADDLAALLDALRVAQPVVLGGLSMGGYVALAFARRHPARLRGLILADTRAEPDTAEGRTNRDKMIAFARQHSALDVVNAILPKMVSAETQQQRPEVVAEVRRIASAQSTAGIIAALAALRDRSDATPALGSIRVPTLVMVGSEDEITPPAAAQTLVDGIPGAKLATVPGAGHLSNLERPDAFNEAVRPFLQTLT